MAQRAFALIQLQRSACQHSLRFLGSELHLLALSAVELNKPHWLKSACLSLETHVTIESNA